MLAGSFTSAGVTCYAEAHLPNKLWIPTSLVTNPSLRSLRSCKSLRTLGVYLVPAARMPNTNTDSTL